MWVLMRTENVSAAEYTGLQLVVAKRRRNDKMRKMRSEPEKRPSKRKTNISQLKGN